MPSDPTEHEQDGGTGAPPAPSGEGNVAGAAQVEAAEPTPREGFAVGFVRGFWQVLLALPFLVRNRGLHFWVLAPALINLALYLVAGLFFFYFFGAFRDLIWAEPALDAWYDYLLFGVWWVFQVVLGLMFFVISYATFTLTGGVVAAPFMEALSQRVEGIELGETLSEPFRLGLILADTAHSAGQALAKLIALVVAQLLVLLLWLIPVAGAVMQPIVALLVLWFFLALDTWDSAFARRHMSLRDKLGAIRSHPGRALGFGAGISAILLVPLAGVVALPLGVIAGTRLALTLPGLPPSDMQSFFEKRRREPGRMHAIGAPSLDRPTPPPKRPPRSGPNAPE